MKNRIENSESLGKNILQENNSKQVSTKSLSISYQFFWTNFTKQGNKNQTWVCLRRISSQVLITSHRF